ncbi:MAG: NERD domain-containing protein [Clostridiales bacterium]|nr:NERD domain-containing protein [Clostridiales bacterium]
MGFIFGIILKILFGVWLFMWLRLVYIAGAIQKAGNTAPIFFGGAFITLFIIVVSRNIKMYYGVRKFGKKLRKNPTNRTVKAYIKFIKKMATPNSPSIWGNLRETYRQVSERDDIDYNLKLQLFEALQVKGTRGVYYPKKSTYISKEEQDVKIRRAGKKGEEDVLHALEWLDRDRFKVFNDIRLPYNGRSQQFDTVIVGDKAVFNIEIKNFIGDLTIDEEGNWYRTIGDRKTGTENVNFQIIRHHKVLDSVLEGKFPIVDLIVWANVESIIEGAQYSPTKVIKVDQLLDFIESYDNGPDLSREERNLAINSIERNKI